MKKITLFIAAFLFAAVTFAQSNKEEVDLFQAAAGMQKREAVAAFVHPSDAQKDAFWKLYDEYEVARKINGQKRIQVLEQYAKQYKTMTDAQAEAWMKDVIALQTSTDKLIITYYKKVKKATSPLVATQFYQIENYILSVVRSEILDEVPFLGEKK
jgi:ribosomal protein S12 methylthiotransferase accessory factor YcaO